MCSSAAQPQTKAVRPQGRANSELRNVAPQGKAAAEAPKSPLKQHIEEEKEDQEDPKGIEKMPVNGE